MPQHLFKELAQLEQVETLALGGSRARQDFDKDSDYDVYVYLSAPLSPDIRKEILSKHCSYMEIGNQFWELEDDCVLNNGIEIELIYRSLDEFDKDLQAVVLEHQAQNSYTTCMWYNLLNSKIIYDQDGHYAALQKKYNLPYPAELKKNIINKQFLLLDQAMPAFSRQIKKALKRQDLLSINHRTSEFFSWMELLFAFNEQLHPGEKRMLQFAKNNCSHLPQNFENDIQDYFQNLYQLAHQQKTVLTLEHLLSNLKHLIDESI